MSKSRIPPEGLSDAQLFDLARRYSIPLGGVYSKADLKNINAKRPRDPKFPHRTIYKRRSSYGYIINLSDLERDNGTHWVGLVYLSKPNHFYYFDPFGFPPPIEVIEYTDRMQDYADLTWSEDQIQGIKSSHCGLYALYFVQQMLRGQPFKTFVDQFTDDPERNDKIVENKLNVQGIV